MNQIDETDKIGPPVLRIAHAASAAGGGFQHMMVDINRAYLCHLPIKLLFAGKFEPFLHSHAGTRIAFYMEQST